MKALDTAIESLAEPRLVEKRAVEPEFEAIDEGRYRLAIPGIVTFELDYLRREGHQLKGELLVKSQMPGAATRNGVLSVGDLNLSSTRSRQMLAKYLGERARAKDLDWVGWLEELALRVLAAEREGQPAVLLSDLPRPTPEDTLDVDGLPLLRRHPVIAFGDGGSCKSYLALYISGKLAQQGLAVGYFDWELAPEDQRDRLELLFGAEMPPVHFARCARPLVHEKDRLRRIVRDEGLEFCVFDSIAPACDGPPESAEIASRFFQSLRQLGTIGSFLTAHVTKALEGADRRPFGSAFWSNLARATWFVKVTEAAPDDQQITVGLYNRKANLSGLRPSVGFEFNFQPKRTLVRSVNVADVEGLAAKLSVPERIRHFLRSGPRTRGEIKAQLEDVEADTLRQALHRATKKGHILEFPGSNGNERYSLPERRF